MSNPAQSKIMQIERRLRQQRDALRKSVSKLEGEVDRQGLLLHFRDASKAKQQLSDAKRDLREVEKKCQECTVWLREAGSSDPKKQENALNRASRL